MFAQGRMGISSIKVELHQGSHTGQPVSQYSEALSLFRVTKRYKREESVVAQSLSTRRFCVLAGARTHR
uniref:Uncharacterized protein n=1 Tax=Amphimedon queenslandica TaxID=400682 RepID=A0A1X7VLC9_AMPQE